MKKLMIAVAAIACATVGLAEDTTITSANVVGYNTITIKGGKYNMFALNFQKVGDDTTTEIGIQDLIPGTTTGLKGGTASTGDEIQVYNPSTGDYTKYYLQYVGKGPLMVNDYKWMDSGKVATATFKNGDSFWYRSRQTEGTDATVTLTGGVSLEAAQEIEIVPGYNMIGNAFPANFNPNALGTEYWKTSGAHGGTASTGDEIQIYNPSTGDYTKYYLQYVGKGPLMVNDYKWMDSGKVLDSTNEVMSVGKGAWYRCRGTTGFTLTIPSPIAE